MTVIEYCYLSIPIVLRLTKPSVTTALVAHGNNHAILIIQEIYHCPSLSKFHPPPAFLLHANLLLILPPILLRLLRQSLSHFSYLRPRPTAPQNLLQLFQRLPPILQLSPVLLASHRHVSLLADPKSLVGFQSMTNLFRDPRRGIEMEAEFYFGVDLIHVLPARARRAHEAYGQLILGDGYSVGNDPFCLRRGESTSVGVGTTRLSSGRGRLLVGDVGPRRFEVSAVVAVIIILSRLYSRVD